MIASERGAAGQSVARVTRDGHVTPVRHVRHLARDKCRVVDIRHVAVAGNARGNTRLPFSGPTPESEVECETGNSIIT